MIPDGYTDIAGGKIAAVVTYFEMLAPPALETPTREPVGSLRLRQVHDVGLDWYRDRYRRAGAPWLWFSRLKMDDERLAAVLHRSTTELFVVEPNEEHEGREIGIAELDRCDPQSVEIASFALFPEEVGKGLGRVFMAELLRRAWRVETTRVWLHTCTLDSPAALGFYMKCGFRAYKRAVEVADDPRIRGILPEDTAPQVPIIR